MPVTNTVYLSCMLPGSGDQVTFAVVAVISNSSMFCTGSGPEIWKNQA